MAVRMKREWCGVKAERSGARRKGHPASFLSGETLAMCEKIRSRGYDPRRLIDTYISRFVEGLDILNRPLNME